MDWLLEVGKRNWVVLTKDERIAKHNLERFAVANLTINFDVNYSKCPYFSLLDELSEILRPILV